MTKSQNSYAGLTPFEVSNVRHRARCLALKPGLGLAVEDIEQELFAHILEKRACYDPERASWPTFVDRILLTKTLDILASARAAKRRCNAPPAPLDAVELVDALTLDQKAADIRIDLSRRAARLPHHQAELICALREKTMSEISRESGVAKTTLYATRAAVQRELEPLQDYLR